MLDGHPIPPYVLKALAELLREIYLAEKNENAPEANAC